MKDQNTTTKELAYAFLRIMIDDYYVYRYPYEYMVLEEPTFGSTTYAIKLRSSLAVVTNSFMYITEEVYIPDSPVIYRLCIPGYRENEGIPSPVILVMPDDELHFSCEVVVAKTKIHGKRMNP